MPRFARTVLALAFGLAALNTQAASVQNHTGLSSPASVVTFSENVLTAGSAVTSYLGLGFSPFLRYDSQGAAAFPGITGHYLGNNGGAVQNPFSIFFGGDVTGAAFGVATNPATTFFEALNDGVVVESFSALTHFDGSTWSYFGFQGITFDEIRVTVGGDQMLLLDNVQLAGAVPEPESAALMLAGLAAVAAMRRRRQPG